MKIIEGLKKIKLYQLQMAAIEREIAQQCAILSNETPPHGTVEKQTEAVTAMLQSHNDCAKEAAKIGLMVQYTNLMTKVTIRLGTENVTHSIAEWILRRRTYAPMQYRAWGVLGDRGLRTQTIASSVPGQPATTISVVRFFDEGRKNQMCEIFRTEPHVIDATLETVNAVTELLEVPTT